MSPSESTWHHEVSPNDPCPEVPKVNNSGSKWTQTDLAQLGVEYVFDRFDKIEIDGDVPAELLQSNDPSIARSFVVIQSYAHKITSVDMTILRDTTFPIVTMLERLGLLQFEPIYSLLASLLDRVPPSNEFNTSNPSNSTSNLSLTETHAKNIGTIFLEATFLTVFDWLQHIQWGGSTITLFLQYIIVLLF
jgi:hypothetical protein